MTVRLNSHHTNQYKKQKKKKKGSYYSIYHWSTVYECCKWPNQNAQWSKLLEKSSTVSRHRPCEMGIPLCYNTQSLFNIQCVFFVC